MVNRGGLWAWPKPWLYRSGIGLILGGTVGGIVAILERSGLIGVLLTSRLTCHMKTAKSCTFVGDLDAVVALPA